MKLNATKKTNKTSRWRVERATDATIFWKTHSKTRSTLYETAYETAYETTYETTYWTTRDPTVEFMKDQS